MSGADPVVARRAVQLRWPYEPGAMTLPISDEALVASHLALRDLGITHDKILVDLYDELALAL
jgi:hypothetical protein